MTTTDNGQAPGTARADGPSVQDVFAEEAQRQKVPDVLRSESYRYLGGEDLPKERYFARDFHDREVEKMWRKVWQVACRVDDIPQVGDTHIYEIAEDSIVLVRVGPDLIKGYYNSCLHRGTQLCVADANVPSLRCPFHGWTWNLDGTLDNVPCQWDFPTMDREAFCLPEVKVDVWDGWVFLTMDPDTGPLLDYLDVLPEHFAAFPLEGRYKAAHVASRVPCNWKIMMEAFLEAYHVWVTHPQTMLFEGDANSQYDIYGPHASRMITLAGVATPNLGPFDDQQAIADSFVEEFLPAGSLPVEVPPGGTARDVLCETMRQQFSLFYGVDLSAISNAETLDAIVYMAFPNFLPWGGFGLPLAYRYRPDGSNPESCIIDVMMFLPVPEGSPKPPSAKVHWIDWTDWRAAPELGLAAGAIFNQDMANLPRIQKGLKTARKPGVTLSAYQEIRIRHHAQTLDGYLER